MDPSTLLLPLEKKGQLRSPKHLENLKLGCFLKSPQQGGSSDLKIVVPRMREGWLEMGGELPAFLGFAGNILFIKKGFLLVIV